MTVTKLLLCICLTFQGTHSFDWDKTSPDDGLVFYICQGATVKVSWQYVLSVGETIGEITWLYNGRSQEMIALQSHGQFIVLPAFSHRVAASGNAGIVLTQVMTGDSGNYSVEVEVFHDSGHVLTRQTVVLDVMNMLMTTDGVLHATQMAEPVQDPQTGQWGIRLQCGKFIFPDNPPFNVEWLSPDGNTINSTDFQDHFFLLDLPHPIIGGNYTCRITPQNSGKACLHGNNTHQGEATAFVDKIDAQLSILLKENQVMKEQQIRLALENQQLEVRLNMTNDELAITKNELDLGNQQLEVRLNQTNNEVNISKNELSQTNSKLSQTNAELLQTKNELSQTKTELSQAKTAMALENQRLERRLNQTSNELSQTSADLSHTKNELSQTKTELSQAKNELTLQNQRLERRLNQTNNKLATTKNELSQTKTEMALENQRLQEQLNQTSNELGMLTYEELSRAKTELAFENQRLEGWLNLTSSELTITKNEVSQMSAALLQNVNLSQSSAQLLQITCAAELSLAKAQLSSVDAALSNRLQRLEVTPPYPVATDLQSQPVANGRQPVAFHATGLQSSNPPHDSPLIFNHVVYNLGNAYNAYTGMFVAPYAGVYYFIGSTGSYTSGNHTVYYRLRTDYTEIAASLSYWDGVTDHEVYSSVHGVVHLNAGEHVFIRTEFNSIGFDTTELYSKFSGFLLYHDLA